MPKHPVLSPQLAKTKIQRLYLNGIYDSKIISKAVGSSLTYTGVVLAQLRNEQGGLTLNQYRLLVNNKLDQLLHNHTQLSSDIQLEIINVDKAISGIASDILASGSIIDLELDDRYNKLLAKKWKLLSMLLDSSEKLFSIADRVGVSGIGAGDGKETHTQGSTKNKNLELPSGYASRTKDEVLGELKSGMKNISKYLKSVKREDFVVNEEEKNKKKEEVAAETLDSE